MSYVHTVQSVSIRYVTSDFPARLDRKNLTRTAAHAKIDIIAQLSFRATGL